MPNNHLTTSHVHIRYNDFTPCLIASYLHSCIARTTAKSITNHQCFVVADRPSPYFAFINPKFLQVMVINSDLLSNIPTTSTYVQILSTLSFIVPICKTLYIPYYTILVLVQALNRNGFLAFLDDHKELQAYNHLKYNNSSLSTIKATMLHLPHQVNNLSFVFSLLFLLNHKLVILSFNSLSRSFGTNLLSYYLGQYKPC